MSAKREGGKREKKDIVYDKVVQALRVLFADDSVSQEETRSRLQGLRDEIDMMIDTLNQDLKARTQDE